MQGIDCKHINAPPTKFVCSNLLWFAVWGKGLGPAAVNLISGMTNSDPVARLTMEQVLAHLWRTEDDD